jgi:mono/diheme cytochrome c family protein
MKVACPAWKRVCRSALAIVLALATRAGTAPATPGLDGNWTGTVAVVRTQTPGAAAGTLAQSGRNVTGSLTLSAGAMTGTFGISGTVRGSRALLWGALGSERLRWRARWSRKRQSWRGPVLVRGGAHPMHATLTLAPDGGPTPTCGNDYFANTVMPTVMTPICSQCHVPSGMAQAAPFRVTLGDATATARSALREVNPNDPLHSLLLEKPLGTVAHGGGQRITPGSPEEQALQHWVDVVSAPGCGAGGGGGGTGADLYTSNCASCHGTDAKGLQGNPDIHCNRSIADAVRNGRPGGAVPMPAFPALSDADVGRIQAFLVGLCPVATVTGAELFASNCATCHGADATGTPGKPNVRCATRVADAVRTGRGTAMPASNALTDTEVGLLGTFLDGLCTQNGRTGPDLWAGNCGTCHGDTGRGGTNGLGVHGPDVHCSRDIVGAVRTGQGSAMPAFAGLSDADVGTLQQYMTTGFCPVGTATGAGLYSGNCMGCHGTNAAGTPGNPDVRCATRVDDALQQGRGTRMPAFSSIAGADLTSLQSYLGGLCTEAGRTGAELYAGNCVTCHGDTGRGATNGLGVVGPDIHCNRSIATPVKAGQGTDMPPFPVLADTDIVAVQEYLTAAFCPAGTATGADLYASNCISCHGADARGVNGNPNIRCNRSIHDAVMLGMTGSAGTMPAFAFSDAEVALVQGYLVGLCPSGAASGSDLFAGNCAICHGADAGGTATALNVRCATRVTDAVQTGRGTAMPSFPALVGADLTNLEAFLGQLCAQHGRTGEDLYVGNCSTCHGANAHGGRNALGVHGEDIQCTSAGDYQDAVRSGDDGMPRFPALSTTDVDAIAAFVHGMYCPGG